MGRVGVVLNVQYIPGVNSKFASEAIFNTGGAVLHYKATPTLDLAAGYSYTRATKANGIADAATYHQFNLSQYYSFSKRTGLYLLEAYQKAKGKTISPTGASSMPRRPSAMARTARPRQPGRNLPWLSA